MDKKVGAVITAFLLAMAVGCADSNSGTEKVWLDVFNAYPGADSLDMYGPSGTVASDLTFGNLTRQPRAVDRDLGTNFELLLDGASQTFQVELPLYNMYPQETATVFFKRRSGTSTVDDPIMYRHIQTGYEPTDRKCRLSFDNGLSVKNDQVGLFSYLPALKIRPGCTSYVDQIGTYDDTNQMVQTPTGEMIQVGRPCLHNNAEACDEISEDEPPEFVQQPWFIPAETEGGQVLDVRSSNQCGAFGSDNTEQVAGQHTIKYVWAPSAEIDFDSGAFRAVGPTREYMECIGWNPDKDPSRQSIESDQVLECRQSEHSAKTVELNNEVQSYRFSTGIGLDSSDEPYSNNQCGFETRMMSDFFNVFDDREGAETPRVQKTIKYSPSQYYFWVPYGRPVNPLIHHWGAKSGYGDRNSGFVKTPPYPGTRGETSSQ